MDTSKDCYNPTQPDKEKIILRLINLFVGSVKHEQHLAVRQTFDAMDSNFSGEMVHDANESLRVELSSDTVYLPCSVAIATESKDYILYSGRCKSTDARMTSRVQASLKNA